MANRLLKYSAPVRVDLGRAKKCTKKCGGVSVSVCVSSTGVTTCGSCNIEDKRCKKNEDTEVIELLNEYFPPVKYEDMKIMWMKTVRSQQSTALEVSNLQQELNRHLKMRCAKKLPLCGVRSEILFDVLAEILRQLVIENPESGKLFKRILDHTNNEIEAYETLIRNSEAMTSRKTIQGTFWRAEGTNKVAELEHSKRQLEVQVSELKQRVDQLEKKNQESKLKREKLRADELKYLKWRGEQMKMQIDTCAPVMRRAEKTE